MLYQKVMTCPSLVVPRRLRELWCQLGDVRLILTTDFPEILVESIPDIHLVMALCNEDIDLHLKENSTFYIFHSCALTSTCRLKMLCYVSIKKSIVCILRHLRMPLQSMFQSLIGQPEIS